MVSLPGAGLHGGVYGRAGFWAAHGEMHVAGNFISSQESVRRGMPFTSRINRAGGSSLRKRHTSMRSSAGPSPIRAPLQRRAGAARRFPDIGVLDWVNNLLSALRWA